MCLPLELIEFLSHREPEHNPELEEEPFGTSFEAMPTLILFLGSWFQAFGFPLR